MMPSYPPLATASQITPAMCSKAASSTGRLGGAPAAIGKTISAPSRLGKIEIGAEPRPGAAIGSDGCVAVQRTRPVAKARQWGRHRREGVGLVLHHRDQQAHRGLPSAGG